LRYLGKKEESIDAIQQLIDKNPDNALYYDTLGEILLYFEDFKEATGKFLKAIVLNKNSWFIYQTYIKLGTCYLALKDYDLAEKNLIMGKDLIQKNVIDPETKQVWLSIADLFIAEIRDLKNEL
jgi:tetratricopeptide (TPR) repeat protein